MKDKIKDYAKGLLHPEDYEVLSDAIDYMIELNPDITDVELYNETLAFMSDMYKDLVSGRDGMISIAKTIDRDKKIDSILDEVDEDDFYEDDNDNYDNFFKDI